MICALCGHEDACSHEGGTRVNVLVSVAYLGGCVLEGLRVCLVMLCGEGKKKMCLGLVGDKGLFPPVCREPVWSSAQHGRLQSILFWFLLSELLFPPQAPL